MAGRYALKLDNGTQLGAEADAVVPSLIGHEGDRIVPAMNFFTRREWGPIHAATVCWKTQVSSIVGSDKAKSAPSFETEGKY